MSTTPNFNSQADPTGPSIPPILIFLDLDNVIADYATHRISQNKVLPDGRSDYAAMDIAWWASIPAFEGAKDFYDALCQRAPVHFLTATPNVLGAYSGKAYWIMDFTGEGLAALEDLIVCPASSKSLLATPLRILVDDSQRNIDQWNAAGGVGIIHSGDFADTLRRVDAAVREIVLRFNDRLPSSPKAGVLKP